MALQAASHDIEDRMYPDWSRPKTPKKRLPRFRLLFLASHGILEAQQAKWQGRPVGV